ncbi:ADAMTS-like protein 5 isoform X4 [Ahaetulla prasina]|nr:ADAMTS-like protein 5 isoform X4 [Ahaetulla prasina]XP_058019755.1 ADAMTS-like protein 5 isoform X4 [Ahaetulla prasina]
MVHWNLTWKQSPSTDSNQPMGHGHTGAAGVLVPVPAGTASPSGSGGVSADSNPRRAEDLSDSDEVQRRQPVPPEGNRNDSANNPGPDGLEEELGGTNSPSDQLDSLPENELRRLPGEEPCRAEARQYRVCERKACPAGIVPFRAMQCTLYNSRPILGGQAQYQWVPFHGAANLCDLNCLAMGHNFYYSFGRVLDGTPCSPASPELCISGRCLRAGCDGVLGSEAQADACGVCGGKNESCVFIQEAFRVAVPASGFFGYRNVTQIPVGARQIRVIDNSRNYLALMEANQHYVLNGEWAVDQPGVFEAAGTQWHYTRTANGHETLEAAGSTSGDLFVMVLFQDENISIDYQYWRPRKQILHRAQGEAHALRQPQAKEVEAQHPGEPADFPEATAATHRFTKAQEVAKEASQVTPAPLRTPSAPGPCGKCDPPRGKSQRLHHYCNSDFVFRARILSKRYVGSETRYDVQVQQTYRNRFPLRSREYLWVPNTCDCPHLLERREYLLMARNHVNFEQTLNRLLLQSGGYARPWSPREDLLLRDAAPRCQPSPPA